MPKLRKCSIVGNGQPRESSFLVPSYTAMGPQISLGSTPKVRREQNDRERNWPKFAGTALNPCRLKQMMMGDTVKAIHALLFVTGIYGLTFLITLFVVAVILLIRWASSGHPRTTPLSKERYAERKEVTA